MRKIFKSAGEGFISLICIFLLLIFFTKTWDTRSPRLFLTFTLILVTTVLATPGIIKTANHINQLTNYDLALISLFAALMYAINFLNVLVPSLIFDLLPSAAGIIFYFPAAIVFGVFIFLRKRSGTTFLL